MPRPAPPAAPLLIAALLAGCTERAPEVVVLPGGTNRGGGAAAESDQCARWLGGAAGMLEPGSLDRTTDAEKAAQLLTLYLGQEGCTGVPPGPLPLAAAGGQTAAAELVRRLLGEGAVEEVTDRRVDAADARFLRTRLLDAAAVGGLAGPDVPPEAVARTLNRYVADQLFPLTGERPAGTTYHARLRGGGDWADRAWLFADLLRQAGLDAVLLTPWGAGDPAEPTAWVGALLPADRGEGGTEVALFDMRTGLPVPSPGDPDRPARLSELRSSEEARTALTSFLQAAGLPAIDPAALDAPSPKLIGEPGWWKAAHGRLSLPTWGGGGGPGGGRAPRLFDPLHDRAGEPGLVRRAAAAGFDADGVTVWDLPARRAAGAADAVFPPTLAAPLRLGLRPARGEVRFTDDGAVEYDPEGAEPVMGGSDLLWDLRHRQLAAGRSDLRAAALGLADLLPQPGPDGRPVPGAGSLLGAPLPPVSARDRRGYRSRVAAQEAIAEESDPNAPPAPGRTDAAEVQTILQAARENGVAPWPSDREPPAEYRERNAAAVPEAVFFQAGAELARDRPTAAAPLLSDLVAGPPNPRKAAAASRFARVLADAGHPAEAAELARQFAGGPDGPRLKVWVERWTNPGASASGGRQPPETPAVESR